MSPVEFASKPRFPLPKVQLAPNDVLYATAGGAGNVLTAPVPSVSLWITTLCEFLAGLGAIPHMNPSSQLKSVASHDCGGETLIRRRTDGGDLVRPITS